MNRYHPAPFREEALKTDPAISRNMLWAFVVVVLVARGGEGEIFECALSFSGGVDLPTARPFHNTFNLDYDLIYPSTTQ